MVIPDERRALIYGRWGACFADLAQSDVNVLMTTPPFLSAYKQFDADAVLSWYDRNARTLPWRRKLPDLAPAYHVFLSELMLQQTVVATVIPYFQKFISVWPDIQALARADRDDVLSAWAGLGYYARARNMHKAAEIIADQYGGLFPEEEAELLRLPGIGPYTAGAIRSFAFNRPAIVLDGNIERVLIRYGNIHLPAASIKSELREAYLRSAPSYRFADFPQALMDIGAGVCQPRTARCEICPLAEGCLGRKAGAADSLPVRPPRKQKPVRQGRAYLIRNHDGQFLMTKRPPQGLLGGMAVYPSTGWDHSSEDELGLLSYLHSASAQPLGRIRHVFTHFTAELEVISARLVNDKDVPEGCYWAEDQPQNLPKLMQKCRDVLPL